MKNQQRSIIALCLLNLIFIFTSCGGGDKKEIGKIITTKGKVEIKEKGAENFRKLATGEAVYAGAIVRTAVNSTCNIQLGEKITSIVSENTAIRVDEITDSESGKVETRVSIGSRGKAMFKVQRLAKDKEGLTVRTPTIVAGIRGTEFSVEMNEGSETATIAVSKGAVAARPYIPALDDEKKKNAVSPEVRKQLIASFEKKEISITQGKELGFDKKETEAMKEKIEEVVAIAQKAEETGMSVAQVMKETEKAVEVAITEVNAVTESKVVAISEDNIKELQKIEKVVILDKTELKKITVESSEAVIEKILEKAIDKQDDLKEKELKKIEEELKKNREKEALEIERQKREAALLAEKERKEMLAAAEKARLAEKTKKSETPKKIEAVVPPTPPTILSIVTIPANAKIELLSGTTKIMGGKNVVDAGGYKWKVSSPGYISQVFEGVAVSSKEVEVICKLRKMEISEKIVLLDNTTYIGKIIKQSDKFVDIECEDGVKTIAQDDIENIIYLKK